MECGQQQWKMKMLLLQCCALRKFHTIDGPNTHDQMPSDKEHPHLSDQFALCEFHSFQVEVQTNAGYIHVTHT